ncbi:unnamed protein product [Choristocarpus tenellus]
MPLPCQRSKSISHTPFHCGEPIAFESMALSPSRGVSAYSLHQLTKRETGETGRCTGCCANSGPVPSKRISVRYKDSQVSVLCYHGTGAEEIRAHIVSRFHVKGGIYFVNNDGEDVVLSSSVPDGISLHLRITEPKAPYRKKVDSEWVLREKQRQGIGLLCSMTVAVAIMFVAIGIMTITTYMFMDQHEGNAVREWQFPLARCKRSLLEALHG